MLLAYGCLVSSPAMHGARNTPLHLLVTHHLDNFRIMKLLLDKGADIDAKNEDGYTTLQLAINLGNSRIIKLLLEHKGYNSLTTSEKNRLLCEVSNIPHSEPGIVENLVKKGANFNAVDRFGRTALHFVVIQDNPQLVKQLLEYKIRVSAVDTKDYSLHRDILEGIFQDDHLEG
jgi:ankyrin repeat protein